MTNTRPEIRTFSGADREHQVFRDGIGICHDERRTRYCLTSLLGVSKPGSGGHAYAQKWLAYMDEHGLPDERERMWIEARYRGRVLKRWQFTEGSPPNH